MEAAFDGTEAGVNDRLAKSMDGILYEIARFHGSDAVGLGLDADFVNTLVFGPGLTE